MALIIHTLNKSISESIGLVSEKYHDHKDRKEVLSNEGPSTGATTINTFLSDGTIGHENERIHSDLSSQSYGSQEDGYAERTVEQLAWDVDMASPPAYAPDQFPRLPYPVIIPQRRPGTKTRGFARAYPPDLASFGIDQDSFLRFLKNFHKASKASGVYTTLFIAANIPGIMSIGLSIAVQAALG